MSQTTASPAQRSVTGTLYDVADLLFFLAMVNLCMLAFTLAGGVILGVGPSLVAAVTLVRSRLRGDSLPIFATFARTWRSEFLRANTVLAPLGIATVLIALNLLWFSPRSHLLVTPLWVGLGLTVVLVALTATMYAHYELPTNRYLITAARFLTLHLAGGLLLLVATAIVVVAVRFIPGLLPVIAPSAWVYLVTALCLSFYTHNDKSLTQQ